MGFSVERACVRRDACPPNGYTDFCICKYSVDIVVRHVDCALDLQHRKENRARIEGVVVLGQISRRCTLWEGDAARPAQHNRDCGVSH